MIVYFDTSAIIPILISEPSTTICRRLWHDADRCVSSRVAFVEAAAALAMAERQQRLTAELHDRSLANLRTLWSDLDVVEVTPRLMEAAAGFARELALRGYDALHCASAAGLNDPELLAASGDARLLAAWQQRGMMTVDTNAGSVASP